MHDSAQFYIGTCTLYKLSVVVEVYLFWLVFLVSATIVKLIRLFYRGQLHANLRSSSR